MFTRIFDYKKQTSFNVIWEKLLPKHFIFYFLTDLTVKKSTVPDW